MKPKHIRLVLLAILILIISCTTNQSNMQAQSLFQPNWEELNLSEFTYAFGDKIKFVFDNNERQGVIIDFSEDEGGKWYGICFLNKEELFGRQIPSGFSGDCVDLLDVSYLNEAAIDMLSKIGTYDINIEKVGIGARNSASKLESLEGDYTRGIEQRNKEQTDCKKSSFALNPIHECYFLIDTILN